MDPKPTIENNVMEKIESGTVKLRSRYVFLAEKLGFGSAVVLSVLLVVLFCNLLLYYLRATDNLSYLSFGRSGIEAFLESFPYLLVALVILCVLLAGFLLKHTGTLYKKPFGSVALVLVGFALIAGAALAFTSIDERLEAATYDAQMPGSFFRPFFEHEFGEGQTGIVGQVVGTTSTDLMIETSNGQRTVIVDPHMQSFLASVSVGDFIIAVGHRSSTTFTADHIRVVGPNEMPLIRRSIHHRFGVPPPGALQSSSPHCFAVCSPGTLCSNVCGAN